MICPNCGQEILNHHLPMDVGLLMSLRERHLRWLSQYRRELKKLREKCGRLERQAEG